MTKNDSFIKPMYSLATLLLLSLTFFSPKSVEQPLPQQPMVHDSECDVRNGTFQIGEELVYKIYYNWNFVWLSAGEVTFRVYDNGDHYHYKATGETYPSYEWFFEVNDTYESWVDKETLLPKRFERSVHEGKYKIYEKVAYAPNNSKATVWRATEKGMEEKKTEHPTTNCVHDVLSILYSIRNQNFNGIKVGDEKPFSVFMDQEQFNLKVKFLGTESDKRIKGLGKFDAMKFQPQVVAGNVFSDDAKMTVWVSNDKTRVPLLIESPVSVGSVKVVLKSHKGLKFPLSSKQ